MQAWIFLIFGEKKSEKGILLGELRFGENVKCVSYYPQ